MAIKPLVAGNWKMNGLSTALDEAERIGELYDDAMRSKVDLMICPPATLIHAIAFAEGTLQIGAQNCHIKEKGAHTGDISAEMLVDIGASAIIVGHSERRADHGETNADVCAKAEAAHRAGATAIICVGETRNEREAGNAVSVVMSQLDGSVTQNATAGTVVIAYEPVWAIGTGLVPTITDIAEMHRAIRDFLIGHFEDEGAGIRILYGGSVNPSNASELMSIENVDGALVGGASLRADDFLGIASAYLG